jgi:hypothetical protein
MLEIPCQQIFYTVCGRNCNVKGVAWFCCWDRILSNQRSGERICFVRAIKQIQGFNGIQSLHCKLCVTCATLFEYELRDKQLIKWRVMLPPFTGKLLARGN